MPFVVSQPSGNFLTPGTFSKRFSYASAWEKDLIVEVSKHAKKDQIRINLISDKHGNDYGFIALSLQSFNQHMALVVDLLFVSLPYRSIKYPELENKKISDFLLGYTIEEAAKANKIFPIRYIALQSANESLAKFYEKRGFRKIDASEWMFLAVPE